MKTAKAAGFCFSFSAVVLTCVLLLVLKRQVAIEQPAVLLTGAVFLLLPFKQESLCLVQQVIGFYLIGVTVNETAVQHVRVSVLSADFGVSYSVFVLLVFGAGYAFGRVGSEQRMNKQVLWAWAAAAVIVVLHVAVLAAVLERFYGYGYERDMNVLGSFCLYVLVYVMVRQHLGNRVFRCVSGAIYAGVCVLLMVGY
jgi:hypothetical protein